MPKFEIIVRETRVLKYKIDAPTQQIGIDRIITDYIGNPIPYQTQRLNREIYAVELPEAQASHIATDVPVGLTPHPEEPTQDSKKKRKKKK